MNVYEFFACFTNLPILIDTVCEQALEKSAVDEFLFSAVNIDPEYLLGQHRLYKADGKVTAHIYYSSRIERALVRLVCCKEILHVLDDDDSTAKSREEVDKLIEQVVIPPSMGLPTISKSARSDHTGMLRALMILMPRDALADLRPKFLAGELSVEDVAQLADIPEAYARFALSSVWNEIIEQID